MSINTKTIGQIESPLGTADEVQVTFDISTWLGTDEINSVVYSAVDEVSANATTIVLTAAKHTFSLGFFIYFIAFPSC